MTPRSNLNPVPFCGNGEVTEMGRHDQKTKKELLAEIDRLERHAEALEADSKNSSKNFLKSVFDKANLGILIHRDWKPLYANPMLAEMYGYGSPKEIMSLESTKVMIHPESVEGTHERILKGKEAKADRDIRGVRKDGSEFWVERRLFSVDWDGEPAVCSLRLDITERKQTADQIRSSHERLQAILDNANQGILIHRHYQPLYANQALANIFGYESPEEIMALSSTRDLQSPDFRETNPRYYEKRMRGEEVPLDLEQVGIKKDGTKFWTSRRGFMIDWDGEPALFSTRTDITDQKNSQQELRESKEELSLILNSVPIGISYFNTDEIYQFTNNHSQQRRLMSPDKLIGKHLRDGIGEEAYKSIKRYVNRVLAGETVTFETLRPGAEGKEISLRINYVPKIDPDSSVQGFFALVEDISEQKNALDKIRESEERYAFAVSGSQNGLWEWNIQTGAQYFSPRWHEILGYEVGELEPDHHTIERSFHPDDKDSVLEAIRAHLEDHIPYDNEYRLKRKDGTYVWVRSRAQAVWDEDGNPIRMAGSANDISHRKKVEQDLLESEARHRDFAADVAHELRTPISALLLQLGDLERSDNVEALKQDVNSMSRLVEQLLALARLDTLIISEADVVDLGEISKKVAMQLGPLAIKENRSLEVLGADNPVLIHGNADALEQAVRNLVENAIKYSSRGTLITTKVDDTKTIQVIDRGQGVPKDLRKEIFGRFERSDRRSGGCGLGLSIVQRTIEAHGGTIDVSETPGGGATFSINFANTIH
jgi:PAS domain S-box-containing protein